MSRLLGCSSTAFIFEHLTEDGFVGGCQYAAKAGLAAVLCRPEQVPVASGVLADAKTKIVTALG